MYVYVFSKTIKFHENRAETYTHIKCLYIILMSQQFCTFYENATHLNCKYFKHQAIVEISLESSESAEAMRNYRYFAAVWYRPSISNSLPLSLMPCCRLITA